MLGAHQVLDPGKFGNFEPHVTFIAVLQSAGKGSSKTHSCVNFDKNRDVASLLETLPQLPTWWNNQTFLHVDSSQHQTSYRETQR
jgi:hypothetical protein